MNFLNTLVTLKRTPKMTHKYRIGDNVYDFTEAFIDKLEQKQEQSLEQLLAESPPNDVVFGCECGCQHWYVLPDGLECTHCGEFSYGPHSPLGDLDG